MCSSVGASGPLMYPLLDTVEPDAWAKPDGSVCSKAFKKSDSPATVLFTEPMTLNSKVESLLSQCRKEALLEAAEYFMRRNFMAIENGTAVFAEDELRRMAEGEK